MSEWTDAVVDDNQELTKFDGDEVIITVASVDYAVQAFWEAISLEGGEQGGQRISVATVDLPTGFSQGATVTYDSTTYTAVRREPDGHGFEIITLTDESTL